MPRTPQEMVDSLLRNGKGRGRRTNGLGETMTHDYLTNAAVSNDGTAVIVRLTPAQAAVFVDLIYGAED